MTKLNKVEGNINQSDIQRFESKIIKTGNCWEWLAGKDPYGYGTFKYNGKTRRAHKFYFEIIKGKIPKGMTLDHLCRVRHCVNPEHLDVITNKENVLRGYGVTANNKRKTHCIRGHELKDDNLKIIKNGRACRICIRLMKKLRKSKTINLSNNIEL